MFKTFSKLISLSLLLTLSFIYTDKVFDKAASTDTVMKEIKIYKKENDIVPRDGIVTDDDIVLGISGMSVNVKDSYKNMKQDKKFDSDKIVYDKVTPNTSISNNYDYYIVKGNNKDKNISIIYKVTSSDNFTKLLELTNKKDVVINVFIDGKLLEENDDMLNNIPDNIEVYNLGYNRKYVKNKINITNSLIENATLKKSSYCLNENRNDDYKVLCAKKKMYSLVPLSDPSFTKLKESLENGLIVSYDLDDFSNNSFNMIINLFNQKGYNVVGLSKLISE